MAGNIQNVNLQKLKSEIDEYSLIASKMHDCLTKVSNYIEDFKTCWTGQRINKVINVWNNNSKSIDDNAFYFAMKIKLILLEIYNQYSALEKAAPKDSSYGYAWGGIVKANLTDETTIRFDKAKVESLSKNINSEVNNANSYLKQLLNKLDSMQGYSDSLKTLATTYKSMADSIGRSLSTVCNVIQAEIYNAIRDVEITEQYNEADAKRAGTAE